MRPDEPPEGLRGPASAARVSSPARSWEDRPNWASCFKPRNPKTEHPPDFVGVMTMEGTKYWVRLWRKTAASGTEFVSVNLQPFRAG
jgi:hypothetical protein